MWPELTLSLSLSDKKAGTGSNIDDSEAKHPMHHQQQNEVEEETERKKEYIQAYDSVYLCFPVEVMMVGLFELYWYGCLSVVLACDSLHVCTVCIWRCEHARFLCGTFYAT